MSKSSTEPARRQTPRRPTPPDSQEGMAKRRRPGKNQATDKEAMDSMVPARLRSEPSPSGPKAGLSATTDALESAAASLTRAAGKPESFFQANEDVAKVRCSTPLLHTTLSKPC